MSYLIILASIYGAWCIFKGIHYSFKKRGLAELMRDHLNYGRAKPMAWYN